MLGVSCCGPIAWACLVEMQPEPLRSQIWANPTGYRWDGGVFKPVEPMPPLPTIEPHLLEMGK